MIAQREATKKPSPRFVLRKPDIDRRAIDSGDDEPVPRIPHTHAGYPRRVLVGKSKIRILIQRGQKAPFDPSGF